MRATMYAPTGTSPKALEIMLAYAAEYGYEVISVTADSLSALTEIVTGNASVIVCATGMPQVKLAADMTGRPIALPRRSGATQQRPHLLPRPGWGAA